MQPPNETLPGRLAVFSYLQDAPYVIGWSQFAVLGGIAFYEEGLTMEQYVTMEKRDEAMIVRGKWGIH